MGGRDHCASRAEPWEEVIARVNGKNAYLISFPDCFLSHFSALACPWGQVEPRRRRRRAREYDIEAETKTDIQIEIRDLTTKRKMYRHRAQSGCDGKAWTPHVLCIVSLFSVARSLSCSYISQVLSQART